MIMCTHKGCCDNPRKAVVFDLPPGRCFHCAAHYRALKREWNEAIEAGTATKSLEELQLHLLKSTL